MTVFIALAAIFVIAWATWTMFLVPTATQPGTPSPATPTHTLPHP